MVKELPRRGFTGHTAPRRQRDNYYRYKNSGVFRAEAKGIALSQILIG